jgi:hypothetical protein
MLNPPASAAKTPSGPFRFERDMFVNVGELIRCRIAGNPARFIHLREPTVGNVIPDLLCGEWSEDLRPPKRSFTFIEACILALLERHDELMESDISQLLHLSAPAAAKAFRRIEQSGLILSTRNGKVSLDAGCFTRGFAVTAVELKLSRWREALNQAVSYLKFADRAYVVLDADRTDREEPMVEMFRASRVGLLMLGAEELTEVVPAPTQHCISPQRVQAVQKLCIQLTTAGLLQASIGAPSLERV